MKKRKQYSQSRIDTHNRQKGIQLLEKITKNLFRMFRNEETTKQQIIERFFHLKSQLDTLGSIALTSEYHREMKKHIERVASLFRSTFTLDDVRSKQMTELNRLQKIKNKSEYKRR